MKSGGARSVYARACLREPFGGSCVFKHDLGAFLRRVAPLIRREFAMTNGALRVSAIALGAAAFVSLASLIHCQRRRLRAERDPVRDKRATSAPNEAQPTSSEATPSLNEPAPTPGWAEGGPPSSASGATAAQTRHYRHYAWRNGHRYVYYSNNPVANAATGVVGSMADLGSLAAYPIYCFPRYGSCPVYWPYR